MNISMALNWQTFRTRTLSAIGFVVVMLTGLLWNSWSFLLLFTVIHFGCWFEYQRLIARMDPDYLKISAFHRIGVTLAGFSMLLYATSDTLMIGTLSLSSIGWWMGLIFVFVLPVMEILFASPINLKNIGYSAFGLVYISLSLALMIHLRTGTLWIPTEEAENPLRKFSVSLAKLTGYLAPLVIIASLWINDTMAYIAGSVFGKTPLSKISPKKTWEGTIGGIVLSVLVVTLIGVFVLKGDPYYYIAISLISSVAGTFGDLLESKLKRQANVKDSGQVLPGHGGFLDRFDSLLLAVPAVWIFCYFLLK